MLIATASSLDRVVKLAQRYFYNKNLIACEDGENRWTLYRPEGQIENFTIIKKGKRYRLEHNELVTPQPQEPQK